MCGQSSTPRVHGSAVAAVPCAPLSLDFGNRAFSRDTRKEWINCHNVTDEIADGSGVKRGCPLVSQAAMSSNTGSRVGV